MELSFLPTELYVFGVLFNAFLNVSEELDIVGNKTYKTYAN